MTGVPPVAPLPEDAEVLAAELALGTLEGEAREEAMARCASDPAFAAAVEAWQARLAPLAEAIPPVATDRDLFDEIARRLDAPPPRSAAPAAVPPPPSPAASPVEAPPAMAALKRRLRRWRAIAALAGALAASLAGFLALDRVIPPMGEPERYVAVLDADGGAPSVLVTIDIAAGTVRLRAIDVAARPDRALEVWYVAESAEPRSLGRLPAAGTARLDVDLARPFADGATIAVSIEPPDGSPTGLPTGEVVYSGRLVRE